MSYYCLLHFSDIKTYKDYLIWSYRIKVISNTSFRVVSANSRDLFVMETVMGGFYHETREPRGLSAKIHPDLDLESFVTAPGADTRH